MVERLRSLLARSRGEVRLCEACGTVCDDRCRAREVRDRQHRRVVGWGVRV